MQKIILVLTLFLVGSGVLCAQSAKSASATSTDSLMAQIKNLQKRIQKLEQKQAESELEKLRQQALQAATTQTEETQNLTVFKSGQRSQQAINPEISVTGDAYLQGVGNKDGFTETQRTGAYFRVLGLHFQSNLDPFSTTKIAVEIHPDGIELGEAYATWNNFIPNVSLTAGKFRQQFGVVNRWHAHSLDQFDFPLALTTILGEDGLNQTGFSLDWLMPKFWLATNMMTLQITNGQNDQLFSGDLFSFPSVLGHLKNYFDLSQNTYFELGLTGMVGQNNKRGYVNGLKIAEPARLTKLAGMDLTLFWEPINRAHYHSFTWRSELYYADKDLGAKQRIKAWGGYSYVQYRMNERWYAGLRLDYTQPFMLNNSNKNIYQIVPYVTWWQSHWVRFRLQYNYKNGNMLQKPESIVRLQLTWAAGPHKHERY